MLCCPISTSQANFWWVSIILVGLLAIIVPLWMRWVAQSLKSVTSGGAHAGEVAAPVDGGKAAPTTLEHVAAEIATVAAAGDMAPPANGDAAVVVSTNPVVAVTSPTGTSGAATDAAVAAVDAPAAAVAANGAGEV